MIVARVRAWPTNRNSWPPHAGAAVRKWRQAPGSRRLLRRPLTLWCTRLQPRKPLSLMISPRPRQLFKATQQRRRRLRQQQTQQAREDTRRRPTAGATRGTNGAPLHLRRRHHLLRRCLRLLAPSLEQACHPRLVQALQVHQLGNARLLVVGTPTTIGARLCSRYDRGGRQLRCRHAPRHLQIGPIRTPSPPHL